LANLKKQSQDMETGTFGRLNDIERFSLSPRRGRIVGRWLDRIGGEERWPAFAKAMEGRRRGFANFEDDSPLPLSPRLVKNGVREMEE